MRAKSKLGSQFFGGFKFRYAKFNKTLKCLSLCKSAGRQTDSTARFAGMVFNGLASQSSKLVVRVRIPLPAPTHSIVVTI